jgi:hypothetical protein
MDSPPRLGRGSFGEVFQVTQKTTGQIYAMKVLRKNKRLGFLGLGAGYRSHWSIL